MQCYYIDFQLQLQLISTGLTPSVAMELATIYENLTETETCFELETVLAYVDVIEEENGVLKKENAKYGNYPIW